MTNEKKYENKFHKLQFKTDAKKDMELDNSPISQNLNAMQINDRFSNKLGVNYRFSGEGEDVDMEK